MGHNGEINPGIDITADRVFQERVWTVSRIGWIIMLAIVIAAALGLTGSGGPLAHQSLGAGQAQIDLPQVSRWAAADKLAIEFAPGQTGKTEVQLPAAFLEAFSIEAVSPQPSSVVATPEGQVFTFDLSDMPGSRSARFAIRAGSPSPPVNVGRFGVAGAMSGPATITVLP